MSERIRSRSPSATTAISIKVCEPSYVRTPGSWVTFEPWVPTTPWPIAFDSEPDIGSVRKSCRFIAALCGVVLSSNLVFPSVEIPSETTPFWFFAMSFAGVIE